MSQPKKDAVIISMKMDRTIHGQLVEYCEKTGLTKTAATEQILSSFFSEHCNKRKKR